MKKSITLLLMLAFSLSVYAQGDRYYKFEKLSGTYDELTGATVLTNTFDQSEYTMNLGFNMKPFNTEFEPAQIAIQRFGAVIGTNSTTNRMFAVDACVVWQFMPIDATSSLSYTVEGSAPERLVKIQYKNVYPKGGDPAKDVANFQVWMKEDGSLIEIHYGPINIISDPSNIYLDQSATGPSAGIFLSTPDFKQKFEVQFLEGDASAPTVDFQDPFTSLANVPTYGTIYKYEHKFIPPPPKSLILGSPVGGEEWKVGEKHDIIWGAESVSKVKIEYTKDNGQNWINIATVDGTLEKYSWTIPNTLSATCKVKISDIDSPNVSSVSNFPFEIKKATSSGIGELVNELNLQAYPNPVTNSLIVMLPANTRGNMHVKLTGLDGKVIYNATNLESSGNKLELDFSQNAKGVYLLEVSSAENVSRQYIIKQ